MNSSNRRTFIKAAGAGAAAVGAVALVPSATGSLAEGKAVTAAVPSAVLPAAAKGAMVAYIHDVSTGEVSVMVEGHEVTVTDHQLVAKIAHALHSSNKA
ncbi:anaerobic selenocysteine-containing dehydrogenase [Nakamurella sp. UYEF19]|uniref:twin-arginine translocation signal domain-containing protein n=1 Tax=Nakamurella sp. UYEF19 TaxID=1756392 RepID=UPI00339105D6